MGDDAPSSDARPNTEYQIRRAPDLQTVSTGAQMSYFCQWKAPGSPPTVMSENYWGPRDGIRWYVYSDKPPDHFWQKQVKNGPIQSSWTRQWDEDPGLYTVIAEIRSALDDRGTPPTYCYRPQQVGDAGSILRNPLDALTKKGVGPSPDDALKEIGRYRGVLQDIAKRFPPPDPQKHQQVIDKWNDLAGRLNALIAPSAGKVRVAMRAMHLESLTQAQRPLLLFFAQMDDVTVTRGRAGLAKQKKWVLVDWTDPSDPRFRGTYEGTGDTDQQALAVCLSDWDSGNRYPEGHVTFDLPPALSGLLGAPSRRDMDTDGKNFTDQVIIVFQWIAIGSMLVAGFCFIFVAIPAVSSAAMATSMLASTAGAVFSIGQRWRDGIFDWPSDAIDGLTIVGNLVGAGTWARGARVRLLASGGKTMDFVFLGTRVATDAAQGVLIAASRFDELDALMNDPSFPPEERARKMLALFAELTALGLMTAMSFRASAQEVDNLAATPKHLGDDPRANVAQQRLDQLTDPGQTIDTTKPPITEGHTKDGAQKTKVSNPVHPAPAGPVKADKTEFAKAYPEDGHPWREYAITKDEIELIDKDGFTFHAKCTKGTLDVTIVTNFDPNATPELSSSFPGVTTPKRSTVLIAKDLYPRMYKHFESVGNPVNRLKGLWAWQNYRDAKVKFDELEGQGMDEEAAAKIAVTYARSYIKYHKPMGFTHVLTAKYLPGAGARGDSLFSFLIEKE